MELFKTKIVRRIAIALAGMAAIGVLGFVIPKITLDQRPSSSGAPAFNSRADAMMQNDRIADEFQALTLGYQVRSVADTSTSFREQCGDERKTGWIVTSRSWWFLPNVKTLQCGNDRVVRLS
jgi:hypothetical protein